MPSSRSDPQIRTRLYFVKECVSARPSYAVLLSSTAGAPSSMTPTGDMGSGSPGACAGGAALAGSVASALAEDAARVGASAGADDAVFGLRVAVDAPGEPPAATSFALLPLLGEGGRVSSFEIMYSPPHPIVTFASDGADLRSASADLELASWEPPCFSICSSRAAADPGRCRFARERGAPSIVLITSSSPGRLLSLSAQAGGFWRGCILNCGVSVRGGRKKNGVRSL